MNPGHPARLVAIVGGRGAGKSWLAGKLHTLLGEKAARLALEDFHRDCSHLPPSRRASINLDDPATIDWPLFERVLQEWTAGRPVHLPRYDARTHCRLGHSELCRPRAVLLVDGLWLLRRPAVRRLFHLKVFIDCSARLRLRHLIAQDGAERRHGHGELRRRFRTTIEPRHRRHVAPQARWADLVLQQPFSADQVLRLHERIWHLLKHGALMPAWMRETFRAELTALLQTKEN